MARTIRRERKGERATVYNPSKRARSSEKRTARQAARRELREYAR